MDKNRIIIIALVIVIIVLLVGIATSLNVAKQDSKLAIKNNKTLTEGDSIKVKLTDLNGTPITNQTVNITLTDGDGSNSYYSVVTNSRGVGKLKLDKSPGKYNVSCDFGGNDEFNGNTTIQKLTIKKAVKHAEKSSSSKASSNNDPGAFYSKQANKMIYTGDVENGPDGHTWKHLGNNKWIQID